MRLFNYGPNVSREKLAKSVEFIDEATAAYWYPDRDLGTKNAAYTKRVIYRLGKGMEGQRDFVVGEHPAVIEYGPVDSSSDVPQAVVTVPVKGRAYRERLYRTVEVATLPEVPAQADDSQQYISRLAIADAVLVTANGEIS